MRILKKLLANRVVRYVIAGTITATFNILLLAALIEFFELDQSVLRNIANIVSIEISVVFSFFVYRTWVWSNGQWALRKILRRQISLYHLSCSAAIITRSFIIFPILNWLGVNYTINSLVGIVIGSGMNYIANERFVFKAK